jgi:hypothetical protein
MYGHIRCVYTFLANPIHTQLGGVVQLVASRFLVPLFVCSTSLAVAAASDVRGGAAVAAVLLAFLTPVPPQVNTLILQINRAGARMCLRPHQLLVLLVFLTPVPPQVNTR